ncbi:hypothetical protein [Butyrivibrio sp. XPD2002]|uniref:hypothetical protein n=1 Tax=Butyrivibrio sp. XPD2002 TaxID=1280665 RepID=UPI0003FDAD46|nr:hypothetical protein [Butyrivibrio sp. XPD2002]
MENTNQNDQIGGELTENGDQKNGNYDPVTGKPYNGPKTYGTQNNVGNIQNENNGDGGQKMCIVSLCCLIIGTLLLFTPVAIVAGVVLVAGYVIAMLTSAKYPKNEFATILICLYGLDILLGIIFYIVVVDTCMSCLNGEWAIMG